MPEFGGLTLWCAFASPVIDATSFPSILLRPFGAGETQDLFVYDPLTLAWTDLSSQVSCTLPAARFYHGFTSTGDKLYIHGGLIRGEDRSTVTFTASQIISENKGLRSLLFDRDHR